MGKRRAEKEQIVAALKDGFGKSEGVFFADYRGLKVSELTELRNRLRQTGAQFQVVKNTLTRLALRDVGLGMAEVYLEGPTAVALATGDVAAPARVLQEFARDHKALELKGGLLGNRLLSPEEIKNLAELPSRDELLARVLGGLQSPLVGAASVLQGLLRNLVYVLYQIRAARAEA